jgi:hypothetical protein
MGEKLIIRTKKVGIIPETLNFNGLVGLWDVDFDKESQEIIWEIQR